MKKNLPHAVSEAIIKFKRSSTIVKVLAVVYLLDFFSFFISSLVLGGDALNGFEKSGQFFLFNHGKLIETTEGIYRFNRAQGISLFILFPILAISSWFDSNISKN